MTLVATSETAMTRQQRLRAAGMCRRCGAPAAVDAAGAPRQYCAPCRQQCTQEEKRRRNRAARRGRASEDAMTIDDVQAAMRELRSAADALGLCRVCYVQLSPLVRMAGCPYCPACRQDVARWQV